MKSHFILMFMAIITVPSFAQRNITEDEWDELPITKPVILEFYANWCAPCKTQGSIISRLAQEFPEIDFYKVNIEQEKDWFEYETKNGYIPMIKFYYLSDDRNYIVHRSSVTGLMSYDELRDSCQALVVRHNRVQQLIHPPLQEITTIKDTIVEYNGTRYHLALQGAVDMGTSVKWAAYNVGAKRPEQLGEYYAWGETIPKNSYTKDNYRFVSQNTTMDGSFIWLKYSKTDDRRYYLDASDDVATQHWGGNWRMPTQKDIKELVSKSVWIWWTLRGTDGILACNENTGNAIFFPLAGAFVDSGINSDGWNGYYWSLEICDYDPNWDFSELLFFDYDGNKIACEERRRHIGFSVRPVYE